MPISSSEFLYAQELMVSRSGVILAEREKYLAEARLAPLARLKNLSSVSELIAKAQSETDGGLPDLLLDALLPTESAFFRDAPLYDFLKNQLFKVLEMKRSHERKIRIWCAGCSSGQEAYSIAMILHRYCSQLLKWDLEILGTDLSDASIAKAAEGRFDEVEVHRGVMPMLIREYFRADGPRLFVKDEIGNLLRVDRLNLLGDWATVPQADVVFLRNVLLHMTPEAQRIVLQKMRQVLKPDGYLFMGSRESASEIDTSYHMISTEKTVYFQLSS